MIQLTGYQIGEQIYTGNRTLVYRGIREEDQRAVVIKLLRREYPTFNDLVQFRNQYAIAKNLDTDGIIKTYSLENYQNSYALVMEDFGGVSLKEYVVANPLSLQDFFAIASQVVQTLDGLYRNRVIHKDIKPANILINPITKQVKLIDFSIATVLAKETQTLRCPNVLEGTLAYISPEQTGRMNRGIDWRSDFYSLGITFFELLTGQLPFASDDLMELVYCHLAKQPPTVNSINPEIPQIISDIIAKLMAKNAEDRYQSALGLKHDLEKAWQIYQETGEFSEFELGGRDVSERFTIPEKLYGREVEVETLLASFERVAKGKREMMLVAGFSGIGKTAVVNEVHKPIVRQRGYFIKGKYDQFQRNIPFSAFVQAFRDLMEQLLSESDALLQEWKSKILAALGEQAQVIIEVIPELERVIGPQPNMSELSGSAATNRFNLLFQKFIQVFTAKEHPLVIFLDDLQWADSASLKLMELVMCESEIKYLLLIGAYRDNEVSKAHPLMLTLEETQKNKAKLNTITLEAFSQTNLNSLVADSLNTSEEISRPLAELIYQKTKGNPFFSNQFLKSLYEDGLVFFNFDKRYWECKYSDIKELVLDDDVVEFMAIQLQKMPPATQSVLKLAACIGNEFDLATLAIVNNKSQTETAADLWRALQEGLVIPTNEVYKFFQENSNDKLVICDSLESSQLPIINSQLPNYKFLHDRVQQAAYFLIPEDEKKSTHFNIGQLLLQNTPSYRQEEKIFDIVNQLNFGVDLIQSQEQLDKLAHLNFIAGKKAKASTAYATASKYFDLAFKIIAVDSWQNNYAFCLTLHEEACDTAYLCGEFQKMDILAEKILDLAESILDKIRIYEIKIQAYIIQNKLIYALKLGIDILKLVGIEFPESPSELDIQQAFQITAAKWAEKKVADLINLPEMADTKILAAMRMLSSMFPAAYLGSPQFMLLFSLKMVELSIQYGNTGLSAFGYCTYGFLLCSVVGDIETGYEFGELSLNVLSKTNTTSLQATILLTYNNFIGYWKSHANNFLKPLQEVYQIGLETGDLEFAGYGLYNYSNFSYLIGKELTGLEREMATCCETLKRLKQTTTLYSTQIWQQTVLNLMNKSKDACYLIGEAYDERVMLPIHQENNYLFAIALVHFNKLFLNYIFGNFSSAFSHALETEKYLTSLTGTLFLPTIYLYDSLVRLAEYENVPLLEQNKFLEKVNFNQSKMEHWANHAPMNFLHKYYLVEAEKHRILGENMVAMEYYDKAIYFAKQNSYLQEEALANELAAKFYLNWNKQTIAQTYLVNAYYCYSRWGASAKVNDLEKRYPQFLCYIKQREIVNLNSTETISINSTIEKTITNSSSTVLGTLDLVSFVKASQAISSEIEIGKLLITLMEVLIENVGASKAVLILPKSGKLIIEAITYSNDTVKTKLPSIPIEDSNEIPVNLISYVSRKQEIVIFNNATIEIQNPKSKIQNIKDPYILEQKTKSLLCNPLLYQGKLTAILYLENNLTTGAFTNDRLQVINLLCSQAVISLENAFLYQQAQDYTRQAQENAKQLQSSLEELQRAQLQLVQSEKMSTLGGLVAGIGHEINNPIGFLAGNLQPAREYTQDLLALIDLYQKHYPNPETEITKAIQAKDLDYVREDLPKVISSMQQAIDRIYDISISLRTFSRSDTNKKIAFKIHEGIDSTLMILKHRLKASEDRPAIEVIKNYGNLPEVKCFPGQLNQVFMNLLANAIDALEESNTGRSFDEIIRNPNQITITTETNDDKQQVVISIQDNGMGMTEEVRARIFDHLFTTKPVGKGTGLGLAIAYQIVVEKHHGKIEVKSTPGRGAAFIISIPLQ